MGKNTNDSNTELIRKVNEGTGTDTEAGGGRNNSNDSKTGTDTGRDTGTDTGTDTGRFEKEKAVDTGLSILTPEEREKYLAADEKEQKRILRNAKRREKYAKEKESSGQPVKPRKVNKTKSAKSTNAIDTTSLNMLIGGLSAVIASRPNCEHWLLSEAEINSISEPLSKMIAETEALQNLGQYSNQIALVTACFTVVTPRMLTTVSKRKEETRIARTGQRTETNIPAGRRTEKGSTGEKKSGNNVSNRPNVGNSPVNGTKHSKDVPWYGSPIC